LNFKAAKFPEIVPESSHILMLHSTVHYRMLHDVYSTSTPSLYAI